MSERLLDFVKLFDLQSGRVPIDWAQDEKFAENFEAKVMALVEAVKEQSSNRLKTTHDDFCGVDGAACDCSVEQISAALAALEGEI